MTTIDYKQKIKDYMNSSEVDTLYKSMLSNLFPELKESEDERIRKALINGFNKLDKNAVWYNGITNGQILAYLEKQGEHANFRNKIQIGDKVTRNEDGVLVNLSQLNRVAKKQGEQNPAEFDNTNAKRMFIKALERVEEQNSKGYKLTDCDKNSWWEDFKAYTSCTIEQKSAGWSEKLIADVFEKVGLSKIVREQGNENLSSALQSALIELGKFMPQQKPAWSEEDEKQARQIERIVHDDGCTQKLQKQIAEWLKSLKDRVQPKQEWSEEDEYCRHQLIVFCENCMVKDDGAKRCAHWLKSIKDRVRPQSTWKPSDEQMNTLEYYMHTLVCNEHKEILFGLYSCLKKLREE